MKNILLIITKLSNGGAERAISLLAEALKEEYNVTLAVFDNSLKEYEPNVNIIDLKTSNNTNILKKVYNFLRRISKIKKIKKQLKIDCSISFLPGPNLVNCLTRRKEKIVVSIRNTQSKLKKDYFRDFANIFTFKKSDKIVTVSEMVLQDFIDEYKLEKNKVKTIYNMVDKKQIDTKANQEVEEKQIFSKNNFNIINLGRIITQKGQWHLIRAFKKVTEKYPNAKLTILGRGDKEEYLKELIKKLELENNVFLLGFKNNPYAYLKASDLFVSTSLYEGMSNVILEAMACGLPIIATDCKSGTREILAPNTNLNLHTNEIEEGEFGILIPVLNEEMYMDEELDEQEEKLANSIIYIIENESKRKHYISKSEKRIRDFNINNIKDEWKALIESD